MDTILVIGGTSGIGEAFAKRWHSMGKKVIITGRRQQKLLELENSLPGADSYAMDNTDLSSLPSHVENIFKKFPDIDTVWVNSGAGSLWDYKKLDSTTDQKIEDEITLNITGPSIIARYVVPKLIAQSKPTQFLITGSGIGFVPNGVYPIYAPTKAFTHHFMVGLRQSLKDTNVNVIEIVPPMVATPMHDEYADVAKNLPQMKLEDFVNDIFEQFDNTRAEDLKEVTAGSGGPRVKAWRESIGGILAQGMGG